VQDGNATEREAAMFDPDNEATDRALADAMMSYWRLRFQRPSLATC